MKKIVIMLLIASLFTGCLLRHPFHRGGYHNYNSGYSSDRNRKDHYRNGGDSRMNVNRHNDRRDNRDSRYHR